MRSNRRPVHRLRRALIVATTALLVGLPAWVPAGATGAGPVADDAAFQVWQDEEVVIALTANDPEGDALSYAVGAPSHGLLTGDAPDLVYTPSPGYTGPDAFTFTVDDGTSVSAAATVTIDVMVPAAITCRDATRTIDGGTTLAVGPWLTAVAALCSAPGGAAVTVDGAPSAASGAIDASGWYTPAAGVFGTDLLTVPVVAGGGAARGTATLAVSVVDPAASSGAGIGIGDVAVWEGDARTRSMSFPVTLAAASSTPVTVRYLITGVDAIGGTLKTPDVDFASKGSIERTLTFNAGQTVRNITVSVYGDTRLEDDETLTVVLSNPSGGPSISDAIGVGTIRDDDAIAGAQLSVGDASIVEGDLGARSVSVPLTLSEPVSGPVTVEYRIETVEATGNYTSGPVAPGTDVRDLKGATVSVTFPASSTTGLSSTQRTVALRVFGDTATEPAETAVVHLLSVTAGADIVDASGVVTILDDDLPLNSAAVRGTVTDTAGTRVSGALVGACVGFTCSSTFTDAAGEYAFADVSPQFAAMPGWTSGAIVVVPPDDGSFRMAGFTTLTRTAGLQVRDLALEIGGVFAVTMLTPTGDPAPAECAGGHVVVNPLTGTEDPRISLFGRDFDGDRHHVGGYTLRVSPPAACPFQRALATGTIAAGATSAVEVTLTEASTVVGVVRDPNGDPIADAEVQVVEDAASLAPWAGSSYPGGFGDLLPVTTGSDGSYSLGGLPVGSFALTVHPPTATGFADADAAFSVTADGSSVTVDVSFAVPATVSGPLLGGGEPMNDAFVIFCPSPPATIATVGCAGGVTVSGYGGWYSATLIPGAYRLIGGNTSEYTPQAFITVEAGEALTCALYAGPYGASGSVSCDESPPPAPKGQLHGTVLADDLSVIGGLVGVIACPAAGYPTPSMGCTGGATVLASGVDGSYSVTLDVGSYTVIGGTLAKLSPVVTVSITDGGTVTCDVRVGAASTISCT